MKQAKLLPTGIKRKRLHVQVKEHKQPRKVYWAVWVEGKWVRVPSPWRAARRQRQLH